jgi:hypothetical protein
LFRNVEIKIQKTNFTCDFVLVRTLSLTLREGHTLSVLENSVLRRIFGPKTNKVMGGWRGFRNEEPGVLRMIKSRKMKWARYVARMERRGMHVGFW